MAAQMCTNEKAVEIREEAVANSQRLHGGRNHVFSEGDWVLVYPIVGVVIPRFQKRKCYTLIILF